MKNILITGWPGIGKTTTIKKITDNLRGRNVTFDGFYTDEIRNEANERIGFSVHMLNSGQTGILAKKVDNSYGIGTHMVGKYMVCVQDFEEMVMPMLTNFNKDILIIDEIGKMELLSKRFEEAIFQSFKDRKYPIIATVTQRPSSILNRWKNDDNHYLFTVNQHNRNTIYEDILNHIDLHH
ncbi:uncharacterized protein LOC115884796 [Sitophilus oryzae]|uniref:Uncharacterized protein LOC115884796 n=1 Tax=Sitophilus oryzae TaxID=7048 RepID=A0A6J2Y880_SITOR|nr:uncharacterized protein LOC115884796 [Sitophilus oryzae]